MKRSRRVYSSLSDFLEDYCRTGRTQADFAEAMGMSNGYLSDLKNGRVRPSLALAFRLSREAGVPVESFLRNSPVSEKAS